MSVHSALWFLACLPLYCYLHASDVARLPQTSNYCCATNFIVWHLFMSTSSCPVIVSLLSICPMFPFILVRNTLPVATCTTGNYSSLYQDLIVDRISMHSASTCTNLQQTDFWRVSQIFTSLSTWQPVICYLSRWAQEHRVWVGYSLTGSSLCHRQCDKLWSAGASTCSCFLFPSGSHC